MGGQAGRLITILRRLANETLPAPGHFRAVLAHGSPRYHLPFPFPAQYDYQFAEVSGRPCCPAGSLAAVAIRSPRGNRRRFPTGQRGA